MRILKDFKIPNFKFPKFKMNELSEIDELDVKNSADQMQNSKATIKKTSKGYVPTEYTDIKEIKPDVVVLEYVERYSGSIYKFKLE